MKISNTLVEIEFALSGPSLFAQPHSLTTAAIECTVHARRRRAYGGKKAKLKSSQGDGTAECNTEGRRVGAAMIALRALRLTMLAFFLWCIVMTLVGVLPW